MMVDMIQSSPIFIPQLGTEYAKLRMSSNSNSNSNWFDTNDMSSFLSGIGGAGEDILEFPQSVPSSSPITSSDIAYCTSSPETYDSDVSPYTSDVSQTPSPFDPSLFPSQEAPQSE